MQYAPAGNRLARILDRPLQPEVVDAPTEQHQLRVQIGGQIAGVLRHEGERRPLDDALLQCFDRLPVAGMGIIGNTHQTCPGGAFSTSVINTHRQYGS